MPYNRILCTTCTPTTAALNSHVLYAIERRTKSSKRMQFSFVRQKDEVARNCGIVREDRKLHASEKLIKQTKTAKKAKRVRGKKTTKSRNTHIHTNTHTKPQTIDGDDCGCGSVIYLIKYSSFRVFNILFRFQC